MSEAISRELSGPERAAAVLLTFEESRAAAVLRCMDEKAIAAITDAMASMKAVPTEKAYEALLRLNVDLESEGAIAPGGVAHFKRLLTMAVGERKASEMIERAMRGGNGAFDALSAADPKALAEQLKMERPQVLAVMLGHMGRTNAAAFLSYLPPPVATDVMVRYARLDQVLPFAVGEMRAMLSEILGAAVAARAPSLGGVREAADILNSMGMPSSDRVLSEIRDLDSSLADKIRQEMFTFDDLIRLADPAIQMVLREVDNSRIVPALRSANAAMRQKIFSNVSSKEGALLKEELETGPLVTRADSQAAQRMFVDAALRLAQEGKISLAGAEDML